MQHTLQMQQSSSGSNPSQHDHQAPQVTFLQRPPPRLRTMIVNLKNDCRECHVRLKKKLLKMDGVKDVEINPEELGGTVTVKGDIDSKVLIMEVIRKYYKRAELVCPVVKIKHSCSREKTNKTSCSDDEDSDSDSDDGDKHRHKVEDKKIPPNENGVVTNVASEPEKKENENEKKKRKKRGIFGVIMRFFGKKSSPRKVTRPPPQPASIQKQAPRPDLQPLMGGYLSGPPRPAYLPRPPYDYLGKLREGQLPPYAYLRRYGGAPSYDHFGRPGFPMGYGNNGLTIRMDPMVQHNSYTDKHGPSSIGVY